jgi:hypothetical protein
MKANIGHTDQVVRGAVGAALTILAGIGAVNGALQILTLTVGSLAVFTAAAAFCPFYRLLRPSRPRP